MDEPINIQGTTGDMLDEPAAALFQHQWQLYRKFVDNNYFYQYGAVSVFVECGKC
jgi:hypothetical protein